MSQFRRDRMREIMRRLNLNFDFIDAIVGAAVTAKDLEPISADFNKNLSRAEIGCLLSHIKAWQALIASTLPCAVILEDDVHLASDFADLISRLSIDNEEIAIYRLETVLATVTASLRKHIAVGRYSFHKLHTAHCGAGSYLLNAKTAAHLLAHTRDMSEAVDIELFDPSRRRIPSLNIFQCLPGACIQDTLLPPEAKDSRLTSNIGSDRADARSGISQTTTIPSWARVRWIKQMYRFAYTLLLLPTGKKRVQVRYAQDIT